MVAICTNSVGPHSAQNELLAKQKDKQHVNGTLIYMRVEIVFKSRVIRNLKLFSI